MMKTSPRELLRSLSSRTNLSAASLGPWIVGLVFAIPTLIVHYPPMTDLPFHEGILGGLVHWGNHQLVPDTIYRLNFGHPNQLFYLLGYPLAQLLGTTAAVKMVVAGTQVATTVAAARLARHLGTQWWTCQIVAASTIGWLYFWGLVANMLGLAVLLFAFPYFDRFAREPGLRLGGAVGGFVVLLYLAHESSLLCMMVAFGITALLLPLRARRWAWYALPVFAAGALGIGEFVLHWSLKSEAQLQQAREVIFDTPWSRFLTIAQSIGGYYPPPIDWALMSVMLVPVMLGVVVRLAWGEPDDSPAESTRFRRARAWLYQRRVMVVAGTFFVLYVLFPTQLVSATLLHQRFLHPAFALFAVWAVPRSSPRPRGTRMLRLTRLAATLALAGPLLTAWPTFQESHEVFRDLDRAISVIDPGQAFFVNEVMPRDQAQLFTPGTACGHILALRGGRCAYDFTQSPISPLLMKPDRIWNEPARRLLSGPRYWPIPAEDFLRFRYMFLWVPTRYAPLGDLVEAALHDSAKVIARKGQWMVFESTILKYDIGSAEQRPTQPTPPTFKELMRDEIRRRFPGDNTRK